MSRHMHNLLTQAAELRAVGHPWEGVAKHVNRKASTCQKWTSRYRREWERLYRHAQLRRFDETSNEAHSVLKGLLRAKDDKSRLKAVEVWLKCGAGTFSRKGNMVHQGPGFEPGKEDGLSEWAARQQGIDEDRAQMSRRRAQRPGPVVAAVAGPLAAGLLVLADIVAGAQYRRADVGPVPPSPLFARVPTEGGDESWHPWRPFPETPLNEPARLVPEPVIDQDAARRARTIRRAAPRGSWWAGGSAQLIRPVRVPTCAQAGRTDPPVRVEAVGPGLQPGTALMGAAELQVGPRGRVAARRQRFIPQVR